MNILSGCFYTTCFSSYHLVPTSAFLVSRISWCPAPLSPLVQSFLLCFSALMFPPLVFWYLLQQYCFHFPAPLLRMQSCSMTLLASVRPGSLPFAVSLGVLFFFPPTHDSDSGRLFLPNHAGQMEMFSC